jgi:hypothetical protein
VMASALVLVTSETKGFGAAFGFFEVRTEVFAFAAGWDFGWAETLALCDLVTVQDGGAGLAAGRRAAEASDARQ